MKISLPLTLAGLLGAAPAARSALTPVFNYQFPASYAGESAATDVVTDTSAGGHPGKVYPKDGDATLLLSDDVPTGAAAGTKSVDFFTVNGSIRTDAIKVLDRTAVNAAGGFTMDLWFKGVPTTGTALQKMMDDTGLDFIAVNGADSDADQKFGQVVVSVGGILGALDIDDGLSVDGWNHITVAFAVTGGDETALKGDVTIVLNGAVRLYPGRTLAANSYYLSFNRPVAVGSHPTGGEVFAGQIYNPKLSFGTEPIPAPSVALTSSDATGFSLNIKDGNVTPVTASSVVTKLNGTAVTAGVTKDGDTTTVTYVAPAALEGGIYTVEVAFNDGAGPHTEIRTFNVVGNTVSPVLDYRFPASYDGSGAVLDIVDQSTAGHQSTLSAALPLSEDVPPAQPAGARSLNLQENTRGIITNEKKLLDNILVMTAGGFTMDVWFKGLPGTTTSSALQKLIDYAGTEFIAVSGADSDNDGSFGELVVQMSEGNTSQVFDADDGLLSDEWNHVTYSYQVLKGDNLASLSGTIRLTLNGHTFTYNDRILTNYGDTLDRPIGIGRHPVGAESYQGLLYNPTVSLGAEELTLPGVTVAASKAAGLATWTLTDGAGGAITPASLVVKVDGVTVTPEVSGEVGQTTAIYTPPAGFASGRHTAMLTYKDEKGASYYNSTPFVIAGSSFEPLLSYSFPTSYDGSTDGADVTDLSAAANNGIAKGTKTELPVALSEDIPPGADAGTKSLSFVSTPGAVATVKTKLLNRPMVITAGGYTFDVWFKGVQGATIQKVIDYAGTEYIGTREADTDGDGNAGEVSISVSNNANFMVLDKDDGLDLTGWNHMVFTFQVTDETNPAAILGNATANLNGTITTISGTLSSFGDALNRKISIGSHPIAGVDLYSGLIYNPVVSYGVPTIAGGDASISLARSGNNLVITFTGLLQSSGNLQSWTDMPNAVSPLTVPLPSTGRLFFRARPVAP